MHGSPTEIKKGLKEQPEELEKLVLAFEKFALHRIAEAEKLSIKINAGWKWTWRWIVL